MSLSSSETMVFSARVMTTNSTACKRFFDCPPNGVIDDYKLGYSIRFFGAGSSSPTTTRATTTMSAYRIVMARDAVMRYTEGSIQRLFDLLFIRMSPITDSEILAEYKRMGGGMDGGAGGSHPTKEHLELLAMDMSLTEAGRWLLTETERDSGLARIVLRYTGFASMDDVKRVIMIRDVPNGGGGGGGGGSGGGVGSQLRAAAQFGNVLMI